MKTIATFFRICISAILFVAALGFAVSNTTITELKFWGLDFYWRAPLVVFLLIFFAAGVAVGILAVAPTLFKQRREVGKLKKTISKASASAAENAKQMSNIAPLISDAPPLLPDKSDKR
jgi:lipopolysaccharide assembly protein A